MTCTGKYFSDLCALFVEYKYAGMGSDVYSSKKSLVSKFAFFANFGKFFTSGHNLKNLICKNKSNLLPNNFSDVYQLDHTCNVLYIDETKKKVITRTIEHQHDSVKTKT